MVYGLQGDFKSVHCGLTPKLGLLWVQSLPCFLNFRIAHEIEGKFWVSS